MNVRLYEVDADGQQELVWFGEAERLVDDNDGDPYVVQAVLAVEANGSAMLGGGATSEYCLERAPGGDSEPFAVTFMRHPEWWPRELLPLKKADGALGFLSFGFVGTMLYEGCIFGGLPVKLIGVLSPADVYAAGWRVD